MKKMLRFMIAMVIVVCMAFVVACSGPQTPENPTTYTLTFNMGGNGVQVESQTIEETQLPQKPADPSAQGYVFGGWYTDSACENQFDFSAAINANTTVYAKWIQLTEDGKYMIMPTINGKNPGQVYADFVSAVEENLDNFTFKFEMSGDCIITAVGNEGFLYLVLPVRINA